MRVGVCGHFSLNGMAVLAVLTNIRFADGRHPGDILDGFRVVAADAAHAFLGVNAHEVLIGLFLISLLSQIAFLFFA